MTICPACKHVFVRERPGAKGLIRNPAGANNPRMVLKPCPHCGVQFGPAPSMDELRQIRDGNVASLIEPPQ